MDLALDSVPTDSGESLESIILEIDQILGFDDDEDVVVDDDDEDEEIATNGLLFDNVGAPDEVKLGDGDEEELEGCV